jgi:choline dehydrogenase-like flavoprotein
MTYDVIVIGSGAGGSAAAYASTQAGQRVLLLEKGPHLPKDGSTLDAVSVLRRGRFLSTETWVDGHGRPTIPEEHFNLGGKTKWYGAALLRFSRHEFEPDAAHQCLGWPFGYSELAPYYDEAESIGDSRRVAAVRCHDGSTYQAKTIVLAAGALHSPRLLQHYLERHDASAGIAAVGRNYKSHRSIKSKRRLPDLLQ